jgi:hypothetical protein
MESAVVLWIACAVICALVAPSRGRDPVLWGLIGLLTAVVGVVLLLALPSVKAAEPERRHSDEIREEIEQFHRR